MNKKPKTYYQYDTRWANKPYRVPGESSTVKSAGCGPTCAAMLIETLKGCKFTPYDACKWSMQHGFKALNKGTYYSYFQKQFDAMGIRCTMLNWTNTYGKPNHPNHGIVMKALQDGYYAIALMNKGLWTSSGHFVVLWWADGKAHINDPASNRPSRTLGNLELFRSQVKYYWLVDARAYNKGETPKGDDKVDLNEFTQLFTVFRNKLRDNDSNDYSAEARKWAVENDLVQGNSTTPDGKPNYMWQDFMTREQFITVLYRFTKFLKSHEH